MSYVFTSALDAFSAFGEYVTDNNAWGDVIGIGTILCSLAFIYALAHKSTL